MRHRGVRHVAAHNVIKDSEKQSMCVVDICEGAVVGCHRLEGEEPMVEWIGGTIVLRLDHEGVLRAYINNNKPIE